MGHLLRQPRVAGALAAILAVSIACLGSEYLGDNARTGDAGCDVPAKPVLHWAYRERLYPALLISPQQEWQKSFRLRGCHRCGVLGRMTVCARRIEGAGPLGESSRAYLLRCTALDVSEHAFVPCALHLHPPELGRDAGY